MAGWMDVRYRRVAYGLLCSGGVMTKSDRAGLLEDAIQVALDNHRGETDQDGEVFVRHPLRVMENVPEDARVVAVLHDVVEDGGSIDAVRARLTVEELQALNLLTRKASDPYDTYIERIATSENRIAVWVKRADLTDNLRPCQNCPEHLRPKYAKSLERLGQLGGFDNDEERPLDGS